MVSGKWKVAKAIYHLRLIGQLINSAHGAGDEGSMREVRLDFDKGRRGVYLLFRVHVL